jgi:galactose-1-phosphate uridylyltransferase
MADEDVDELGPVDYLVVEFKAEDANFSGEMAAELSALIERGVVRVLDLMILKKELDGSVEGFESHDFGNGQFSELRELETEMAMLLAEEDVESIGAALEPGSIAAVLVFENVWAAPFGSAVRHAGGQLVASGRIPIQALAAALEADEAATTEGD